MEESFVSLHSASSVSSMSAFGIFSNSEVKKDDESLNCTFAISRSKTVKQQHYVQTVHEEECESGDDDDKFNNRGSELDACIGVPNERAHKAKTAIVGKQASEFSDGSA